MIGPTSYRSSPKRYEPETKNFCKSEKLHSQKALKPRRLCPPPHKALSFSKCFTHGDPKVSGNSQQILIVDDDENIRTLLTRLVQVEGFTNITVKNSGIEAVQYLTTTKTLPNLVLLDVDMPDMDGWLVCEIIKKIDRWKKIEVVFQSALRGADNIRRGLELGAHSYIEKPYTRDCIKQVFEGVFKSNDLPETTAPTPEIRMVVKEVADAIKHTFNLMLGSQTEIIEAKPLIRKELADSWDFAGRIPAKGVTEIAISTGWARGLASTACKALTQLEPEDLDDELILDSMQEILNMVLGAAVRTIGKTFPVKLSLPTGGQSCEIPYDADAPHVYRIEIKANQWLFPLIVTIKPTPP